MPDRADHAPDRFAPADATDAAPVPHASQPAARTRDDRVLCERCGREMFRMHAVWRCPGCGYKTDCCGW
jgi:hypothetical protein